MAEKEIAALIAARGGGGLPAVEQSRIRGLSRGVPLFAVELTRTACRGGAEENGLPLTLAVLVQSRLDGLRLDRGLLHRLARHGDDGEHGETAAEAEIARAVAAGVIVRDGKTLEFAHPLVREVVLRCGWLDQEGGDLVSLARGGTGQKE